MKKNNKNKNASTSSEASKSAEKSKTSELFDTADSSKTSTPLKTSDSVGELEVAETAETDEAAATTESDMAPKKTNNMKIIVGAIIVILVGLFGYFSYQSSTTATLNRIPLPQLSTTVAADEAEVELDTTAGNITIKLFPKYAPLAVQNFMNLAKQGYYNNNEFFRVLNNFMVQTGDPGNNGQGSKSTVNGGQPFPIETSTSLYNIRGAVSLANDGQSGTNSSQFFIVQNPKDMSSQIKGQGYPPRIEAAYKKGGYPKLDAAYTVFGQVTSGMDVVDKIAKGAVKANSSGEKSLPLTPFKITGVKVLKDIPSTK